MSIIFLKDPAGKLDYTLDWAGDPPDGPWLAPGDTIANSSWTDPVPPGLTKVSDDSDDTTTTVWLEGGNVGVRYTLTNQIVTAEGRRDERDVDIVVRER